MSHFKEFLRLCSHDVLDYSGYNEDIRCLVAQFSILTASYQYETETRFWLQFQVIYKTDKPTPDVIITKANQLRINQRQLMKARRGCCELHKLVRPVKFTTVKNLRETIDYQTSSTISSLSSFGFIWRGSSEILPPAALLCKVGLPDRK